MLANNMYFPLKANQYLRPLLAVNLHFSSLYALADISWIIANLCTSSQWKTERLGRCTSRKLGRCTSCADFSVFWFGRVDTNTVSHGVEPKCHQIILNDPSNNYPFPSYLCWRLSSSILGSSFFVSFESIRKRTSNLFPFHHHIYLDHWHSSSQK